MYNLHKKKQKVINTRHGWTKTVHSDNILKVKNGMEKVGGSKAQVQTVAFRASQAIVETPQKLRRRTVQGHLWRLQADVQHAARLYNKRQINITQRPGCSKREIV